MDFILGQAASMMIFTTLLLFAVTIMLTCIALTKNRAVTVLATIVIVLCSLIALVVFISMVSIEKFLIAFCFLGVVTVFILLFRRTEQVRTRSITHSQESLDGEH